jgi:serine/threonine protein kinase
VPAGSFRDRYDLVDSGPRDEGGFGEIYQAKRKSDGALVAVKFLKDARAEDARDRARFDREADTLAYLQSHGGHPHVLPYYDHGEHEGRAYLVTGWAGRGTVDRALRGAGGSIPLPSVQAWLVQLLRGLEFLHAHGVVHRDLKPANLFLWDAGVGGTALWIGDFGVALLGDRTRFTAEGSGSPGTPAYAAPEQRAGAPVQDARTDLRAFGVVAFQLITGGRPRPGERSARQWRSELTTAWDEVVAACMESRRERRPASAAEVLERVGAPVGHGAQAPARR